MKYLMIVLMLATANVSAKDIKPMCKEKWPTDYQMQMYCHNNQVEAQIDLIAALKTNGFDVYGDYTEEQLRSNEVAMIFFRCTTKWPDDYQMTLHCVDTQVEAYNKING